MNLKIGIEVEFFVTHNGKLADASLLGLPHDDYPIIAEARGKPSRCAFEAVHSVLGEIERMVSILPPGHKPLFANWAKKDDHWRKLNQEAMRRGMEKSINWENLHGLPESTKNDTHVSAGMHISFTNPQEITVTWKSNRSSESYTTREYNAVFDYAKLFLAIEKEFDRDIARSGRTKGFYEIKDDGRIEYRSLPATLIHTKGFAANLNKAIK